jgi:hypothetical protein
MGLGVGRVGRANSNRGRKIGAPHAPYFRERRGGLAGWQWGQ